MLQELREIFIYDPHTGTLAYKKSGIVICGYNARTSSGQLRRSGYPTVRFNDKTYQASRIIWALVHGHLPDPDLVVEHVNGDIQDYRISNLRLITRSQNAINANNSRRLANLIQAEEDQRPDAKPEIYALALKQLVDVYKALSSEPICDHQITQLLQPAINHIREQLGPDLPEAAPPPGITDPLA